MLLLGAVSNSVDISALALQRTQAGYLLEEGAEATKIFRDVTWNNVANLSYGTAYEFSWNGTTWVPGGAAVPIGIFTRTVTCFAASRDANNDLVTSGGTADSGTRRCEIAVSWPGARGAIETETMSFYISNIR